MSDTQTIDYADRATPTGEPDKRDRDLWLAALLLIDDGDIDAAKQLYVEHAPRALRGLLSGDGFTFDPKTQLYTRDATGKAIAGRDVKRLSILLALAVAHELEDEAQYVADGTSPIDLWQSRTADKVKDAALMQSALAAGGFGNLGAETLGAMKGDAVKPPGLAFSLSRLYSFAQDIAGGVANSVKGILNRAGLYGTSGNGIYETVRRESHTLARDDKGRRLFLMERNVLGEADHCSECPELSAMGWVEMGTMPPPGSRECNVGCKCHLEYSLAGDLLQQPRA